MLDVDKIVEETVRLINEDLSSRIDNLVEEEEINRDDVYQWLNDQGQEDALRAVPEGVWTYIIEESLSNGGIETDDILEHFPMDDILEEAVRRGTIDVSQVVEAVNAGAGERILQVNGSGIPSELIAPVAAVVASATAVLEVVTELSRTLAEFQSAIVDR